MTHDVDQESADESITHRAISRKRLRTRAVEHYVTKTDQLEGHVTQMDIILSTNPFSIQSIGALDKIMAAVPLALPSDQAERSSVSFAGPTASVRDVNAISQSDQVHIYVLVVISVFVILVSLLKSFGLSLYLLVTVLLSYLATLGATWLFFYCLDPREFIGLDWTVPLFLFVVLIAVGEDYNIFLVTRIHEEQKQHGVQQGITIALARTGGIITSCGFIMAGSFASLCIGSLARMQQLGVALAVGVLLDTFIVRPILVPAFLMAVSSRRSR